MLFASRSCTFGSTSFCSFLLKPELEINKSAGDSSFHDSLCSVLAVTFGKPFSGGILWCVEIVDIRGAFLPWTVLDFILSFQYLLGSTDWLDWAGRHVCFSNHGVTIQPQNPFLVVSLFRLSALGWCSGVLWRQGPERQRLFLPFLVLYLSILAPRDLLITGELCILEPLITSIILNFSLVVKQKLSVLLLGIIEINYFKLCGRNIQKWIYLILSWKPSYFHYCHSSVDIDIGELNTAVSNVIILFINTLFLLFINNMQNLFRNKKKKKEITFPWQFIIIAKWHIFFTSGMHIIEGAIPLTPSSIWLPFMPSILRIHSYKGGFGRFGPPPVPWLWVW